MRTLDSAFLNRCAPNPTEIEGRSPFLVDRESNIHVLQRLQCHASCGLYSELLYKRQKADS